MMGVFYHYTFIYLKGLGLGKGRRYISQLEKSAVFVFLCLLLFCTVTYSVIIYMNEHNEHEGGF